MIGCSIIAYESSELLCAQLTSSAGAARECVAVRDFRHCVNRSRSFEERLG